MTDQTTTHQTNQDNQPTAVMEQEQQPIQELPEGIDFLADAEDRDSFSRSEREIPYIFIIGDKSKVLDPKSDRYIEGAEIGDLCNSLTGRIYKGTRGIVFCHALFDHYYLEFEGKEIKGQLVPDDPKVLDAKWTKDSQGNKYQETKEGTVIVETHCHYGLVIDPDDYSDFIPAAISMKKTRLKQSKRWNGMLEEIRYKDPNTGKVSKPLAHYAGLFQLTSALEESNNNEYYVWRIKYLGLNTYPMIYETDKAFRQSIKEGQASASYEFEAEESQEATGETKDDDSIDDLF